MRHFLMIKKLSVINPNNYLILLRHFSDTQNMAMILCFEPSLLCSTTIVIVSNPCHGFLCCAQVTLVKMVNEATANIPNWDSYAAAF
jgi:hypothetical protein